MGLPFFNQSCVIHQAPSGLPGHQQIEAAVLCRFTANHGSEHPQAVGTAPHPLCDNLPPQSETQRPLLYIPPLTALRWQRKGEQG